MFNNKKDPLLDQITNIMGKSKIAEEVERNLCEDLGIVSKKALPFEYHTLYENTLKERVNEALHPNQQKLDVHEPEKDKLTAQDFTKIRAMSKKKKPIEEGNKENKAKKNAAVEKRGEDAINSGTPAFRRFRRSESPVESKRVGRFLTKYGTRRDALQKAKDKLAKEEVEKLDELSKKTLGSYVKQASDDVTNLHRRSAKYGAAGPYWREYADKLYAKSSQRRGNVNKAVDKLTKEEVEQNTKETKKTFPNVKYLTKDGHPDWEKHGIDPKTMNHNNYWKKVGDLKRSAKNEETNLDEKCWKGYEMFGLKNKNGKKVPNCVPKEEVEKLDELSKKKIKDYISKNFKDIRKYDDDTEENNRKVHNRSKGLERALDKRDGNSRVKVPAKKEKSSAYFDSDNNFREDPKARAQRGLDEVAPPGAKFERMIKHIKKGYAKDGLSKNEKSIAYATAWKAKNKEEMKEAVLAELKKNLSEDEFGVPIYPPTPPTKKTTNTTGIPQTPAPVAPVRPEPKSPEGAITPAPGQRGNSPAPGRPEPPPPAQVARPASVSLPASRNNRPADQQDRMDAAKATQRAQTLANLPQASDAGSVAAKPIATASNNRPADQQDRMDAARTKPVEPEPKMPAPPEPVKAPTSQDIARQSLRAPVAAAKGEGQTGSTLAQSGVSRQDRLNPDFVKRTLGADAPKAGSAAANLALKRHFDGLKNAANANVPANANAPAKQAPRPVSNAPMPPRRPVMSASPRLNESMEHTIRNMLESKKD